MGAASTAGPSLGLVIVTLASMAAGFMVAQTPAPETFQAVGDLGPPGEAYGVELDRGQTVRLSSSGALPGAASVAVFDPGDRLVEHVRLDDGSSTELSAGRAGTWVLVPTGTAAANVTVEVPTEQMPAPPLSLEPLSMRTVEEPVAELEGEALDVRRELEIDRRPALAYLALEGNVTGLDATVRSPTGRVLDADTPEVNGTRPLLEGTDGVRLSPAHLVPGAYRITARGDRLTGTLSLVHATYERPGQDRPRLNESVPGLGSKGVPVAVAGQGQAVLVDAQGADQLRLATAPATSAVVYIYDQDDVDTIVHLGRGDRYSFDWGSDTGSGIQTAALGVNGSRSYVAYVEEVDGESDAVHVLLPGLRTAAGGRTLEITEQRVHVDGSSVELDGYAQVETNVTGGIVGVSMRNEDTYSGERRVRVAGPHGLVFEHLQRNVVAGDATTQHQRENPAHYADGPLTIIAESDTTVEGDVWVTIRSYVR